MCVCVLLTRAARTAARQHRRLFVLPFHQHRAAPNRKEGPALWRPAALREWRHSGAGHAHIQVTFKSTLHESALESAGLRSAHTDPV